MTKKFPIHPANPQRLCWGCDRLCASNDMLCGNGSDRTPHPVELFGNDWMDWIVGNVDKPLPKAIAGADA
nr:DUF3079 domain-containing protein [uncultured Rhodoferax sp.]